MATTPDFEYSALTDTGLVRSHNEDAVAFSSKYGIAILADGMGGYSAGEVASEIAITVVMKTLEAGMATGNSAGIPDLLVTAIQSANTAILEAAAEPRYHGMGTTIVAAVIRQGTIAVAHVGDSRAYRLRKGELLQITRDHSVLQQHIDAGLITPEAARTSPIRNLVTRAVGTDAEIEVEVHEYPVEPGDSYLLCSDGLTDMIEDALIRQTLLMPDLDVHEACEVLVQQANAGGGNDNVSVILIKVPAVAAEKGLFNKLLGWVK